MTSNSITVCQIGAFHLAAGKTPSNADSLAVRLAEIGINSIRASVQVAPIRRVTDMWYTLVRNRSLYRVVIVHVYSGRAFLWALTSGTLAKRLGKKLVLWLHGGNLPAYYARHGRLVESLFRQADHIVAPSSYLAQAFSPQFEVNILPYELPIQAYPHRLRTSVRPKLLWLRAFGPGYNPKMAVRVVKSLVDNYANVALTMCGPDTGSGSLQGTRQLAQELGVEDRISFPGLVSKERIKELGLECDIFINTTSYDNTPVSVIEAMTMGMCVVSTNVGGVPYLVSHELDGLLVPPNDPDAMAQACHRLLTDPSLAQHLSHNARQKARSFDWEDLAPKWQALLTSLDSGSGGP